MSLLSAGSILLDSTFKTLFDKTWVQVNLLYVFTKMFTKLYALH
jgi:hypothetical protein